MFIENNQEKLVGNDKILIENIKKINKKVDMNLPLTLYLKSFSLVLFYDRVYKPNTLWRILTYEMLLNVLVAPKNR